MKSKTELINHLVSNKCNYLFFYGHTNNGPTVTKTCFSQWYPISFTDGEITYKTAEHYMMAQKALVFGDHQTYQKILEAETPKEAKELGRAIKNYSDTLWNSVKFGIVVQGNILKFQQNPALKSFILSTGNDILVEASLADKIWGIGMDMSNPDCKDPSKWNGENLLGFALMEARTVIKSMEK